MAEEDIELKDGQVNVKKLSARDKMLLKRNLNRIRESEKFQAGRVLHDANAEDEDMSEVKSFTFWACIGVLYFFTLCNVVLTIILMAMLRIGWGMETIEMMPFLNLTKFYGNIDLGKLYKDDGYFSSFKDAGITISGKQGGSIHINVSYGLNSTQRMLSIAPQGVEVLNVKEFNVFDPEDHTPIFSTGFPNFGLPRGVKKLDVQQVRTSRITSPIESNLILRSETYTRLKGNEGVHMEGRTITWSAHKDIFLKSVNGSIVFKAKEGIFLDVKKIPIVKRKLFFDFTSHVSQYKLCACMPEGKLFRVFIKDDVSSHNACQNINTSPENHPCR